MEFNKDPEWLRRQAAREDNCQVAVGIPAVPGPEAPHECTCGRCTMPYISSMPNWAEVGYCDPCIAIMSNEMQAVYDAEPQVQEVDQTAWK